MAKNTQLSNATVNGQADYLSDQLDNGYLRIYDGSQPANADTAIGAQVLLAELRFNATAAPAASAGVLTFNAITADSSANATGTGRRLHLNQSLTASLNTAISARRATAKCGRAWTSGKTHAAGKSAMTRCGYFC